MSEDDMRDSHLESSKFKQFKGEWKPCYACPKPDEGFPPCEVCGGEPDE